MNVRAIVFIACRLMAIYLLVTHALNFVIQMTVTLLSGPAIWAELSMTLAAVVGSLTLATALYGLLALFLWNGAGWISKRVAAPVQYDLIPEMDFDRWQAVIIMGVGLMALLGAAELGGEAFKWSEPGHPFSKASTRSAFVFAVIGLLLISFPLHMSRWLSRVRGWAAKPMIDRQEP